METTSTPERPRVVLVTGVAGFIGRHAATAFAARGDTVIGADRSPSTDVADLPLARYESVTIPDPAFDALVAASIPDVVVHCAGRASVPGSLADPADDFTTNTAMTFAVLELLRTTAPEAHVLFPSSAAVYGDPATLPVAEDAAPAPISPYGFHKLQAEQLCREYATLHGLTTTVMRLFSAYGPGLRRQVVWDTCVKALTDPTVRLRGTGRETRDLIHVDDITAAMIALADVPPESAHRIVNVATGVETTIEMLADLVVGALDVEASVVFDQVVAPGDPINWRADISRLRSIGFEPQIDLATGVRHVATWAREQLRPG